MGLWCIVPNCPNKQERRRTSNSQRSYVVACHKFPKRDPELLKIWFKNLTLPSDFVPLKHHGVCSSHFERKHLRVQGKHFYVRKTAVPTILPIGDTRNGFKIETPPLDWDSDPEIKKVEEMRQNYKMGLQITLNEAMKSQSVSVNSSCSCSSSDEDSGSGSDLFTDYDHESETEPEPETIEIEENIENEEPIVDIDVVKHDHFYLEDKPQPVSRFKYDKMVKNLKSVRWRLRISQQRVRRLHQQVRKLKETVAEQKVLLKQL